jgi:hypothetical protein
MDSRAACASLYARSSRLSPPTNRIVLRSVPRPNSFTTLSVCRASSRDGDMMTPRAPTLAECVFSFSIMGMTNAAVLPDPVRAMPTTSSPCMMRGTALRWMGVGILKPFWTMALSRAAFRPIAWKPPPFLPGFPGAFAFLRFAAACFAAMKASSSEPSSLPMLRSIPRSVASPASCCAPSAPARASKISNSFSDSAGELARGAMARMRVDLRRRAWNWGSLRCPALFIVSNFESSKKRLR